MIALLAIAAVPFQAPLTDRCDVIEINHLYDGQGKRIFTQYIFWEWEPSACRFEVVAWRLAKRPGTIARGRGYTLTWQDGDELRRVRAHALRRTWTQHDPEIRDRRKLPKDQRRGLVTPRRTWSE